ncbi:MAG TPA: tetratricopeptide repeat-containing glycosyltransferase family protein [Xanthobacteraceae bacterium]|jgi:tetratricopeptide (TPR) repeat protein|nr:tetratricopeptide repeat-containing glycosyltransferase family protein [Xanthobacteraceae bacterium]
MPKPPLPPRLIDLGPAIQEALALHRQGRLNEAEKIYTRVLKSVPKQFDCLHLLGMLKHQRGKTGEAYRLITAALEIDPRSADALTNLGLVLHALGRNDDALASLNKALALSPNHVEALNNKGNVLLALKRADQSLDCYGKVLALQPRHIQARVNRGSAYAELGRWNEAIAEYEAAIALHPAHADAHYGRGNALQQMGRDADAVAAYDKALAIMPQHIKAWNGRGVALQALNRYRDAIESYGKALAIQKDYADAHYNEALALLTSGELQRGFAKYEWRWKRTGMPADRRNFGRPLWLGEYPLRGKTILLHAEQGLGDTLQFVRYAALLARAGAKVALEVQPELKTLLSQLHGASAVIARGEPLPPFDVHCPLASLPFALKTDLTTIPADVPYLRAPQDHMAKWRDRLALLGRPLIAIAWSGRSTHANDRNRSIAWSRLEPILSAAAGRIVSVQVGVRDQDAARLRDDKRIAHFGDDIGDFGDTAAILAAADLVISVDTSIAHLAGSMGRPAWILLPSAPDWRWLLDRTDSPWYPTARLFRQPLPGDWDSVIGQVASELKNFV